MSLRNIYNQTANQQRTICHQHAMAVLAELNQQPMVELLNHDAVPMPDDDWRWRWCFQTQDWNQPRETTQMQWSVQLSFSYRHNWLVIANPNTSGRSIQFAACVVDDNRRNAQRPTIIRGSVYDFASLWKRLDKNKHLIPKNFRYWTFINNHA